MRPICNEKVAEKWNLWVREHCTNALFTMESKHLRLLFNEQCINSSRITPKRVKKKKKKERNMKITNANAAKAQSKWAHYVVDVKQTNHITLYTFLLINNINVHFAFKK